MKKNVFCFIVVFLSATQVLAQATVKSMTETTDFIAGENQRRDYNKQLCALVKVQVVDDITDVEGNVMGDIVNHGVEKWVYLAQGSRNMKIHLKNNLAVKVLFRDYGINGLKSNRVYELVINTGEGTHLIGQEIRVSLTNGSILIGKLEALDILNSVTINMAGISSTIPIEQVVEIQNNGTLIFQKDNPKPEPVPEQELTENEDIVINDVFNKINVTETTQYPSSYNIKIGNEIIHMILVRGGCLKMGYDGKGSEKLNSEPVHSVNVSSFYISEEPISANIVNKYLSSKMFIGEGAEPAEMPIFDNVNTFVSLFAESTRKPYRLPTEAEWEYAACSEVENQLFQIAEGKKVAYEWCSDYYDDFSYSQDVITDPTGPESGKQHVVRAYNRQPNKFNRNPFLTGKNMYKGLVRIAIKANQK